HRFVPLRTAPGPPPRAVSTLARKKSPFRSKLSVSTAAKCERPATGPPFWPGFIAHRLPRAPMTRKTG
ncbi:hypothetical protein A8E52_25700, partial [Burkholderia cenocepacia]